MVVESDDQILDCHCRPNLPPIAVGDNIIWQPLDGEQRGVIVACQPRRSSLKRYHKYDGEKLIASNIDQVAIVVAPIPERSANVLDRYLLLAELQQLEAIIIINKQQLVTDANQAKLEQIAAYYHEIGYQVLQTDANSEQGKLELEQQLSDKTTVFVGVTGVGKSSLTKMLIPDLAIRIGELSLTSQEGMHTTTTARLYHLPLSGNIIDCPGIRELSIGQLSALQILQGFIELDALSKQCKYRNCNHINQQGCALTRLIDDQSILGRRYQSMLQLFGTST
jgi:ribosome biogenesis GTPase